MAAVAEGPFRVTSTRGNTVVIKRPDDTVERVSRDRVVLAPNPFSAEELTERTRPLTDAELLQREYPVEEEVNLRDVITPSPEVEREWSRIPTTEAGKVDKPPEQDDVGEGEEPENPWSQVEANHRIVLREPTSDSEENEVIVGTQPGQVEEADTRSPTDTPEAEELVAEHPLLDNGDASDVEIQATDTPGETDIEIEETPTNTNAEMDRDATLKRGKSQSDKNKKKVGEQPTGTPEDANPIPSQSRRKLKPSLKIREATLDSQITKPVMRREVENEGLDAEVGSHVENTEYVVERVVADGLNEDENHPTAKIGEPVYRVRWYGYSPSDDTWEPVKHFPRNKLVSYCHRKGVDLPPNIDESQDG